MRAVADAWRGLVARAIEPSVFAEPGFLLPAFQHLPEGRHVAVVCVWQGEPQDGALRGLLPTTTPRFADPGRIARVWRPPFSFALPALIDGTCLEPALDAALAELGRQGVERVLFPRVPLQGPFAAALRTVSQRTGRRLERVEPGDRRAGLGQASPPAEPDRLRENLSAFGEVRIDRMREPRPVRDAVEEFLVLEASARGSAALIQDVGTATFVRTMTREMARTRRCRVDILRVGGKPAAAAIVLKGPGCVWLWNLVEDPSLAARAPGALLARDIARTRPKRTRLEFGDAGGLGGDPALRALGADRTACGDFVVAVRPDPSPAVLPPGGVVGAIRAIAARAYASLTGRRAPAP